MGENREPFDPYHKWLGIAPKDQPPNHYRLLGIELFEADPEVIDAAANRQMTYLQQRVTGQHSALLQKLLNEIAAARLCLLTPEARAIYDAQLQQRLAGDLRVLDPVAAEDLLDGLVGMELASGPPLSPPRYRRRRLHWKPWQWAVAIGALLLVCLGMLALLTSGRDSSKSVAVSQMGVQVADLESKIAKWQSNRDKLKALLDQLQHDRTAVLEKLDRAGVRSNADVGKDPRAEVLSQELKNILQDMAIYEKKYKEYDLAILKSESRLRSIARRMAAQGAGGTDAELEDLSRSMITLDESLKAEDNVTMPGDSDNTLQRELESFRQGRSGAVPSGSSTPESKASGLPQSANSRSVTVPGRPPDTDPLSWAAAIYNVTITPDDAHLEVSCDGVRITGEGQTRLVMVTSTPLNGCLLLTASCPGYKSVEERLTPLPGSHRNISFNLERLQGASRPSATLPDAVPGGQSDLRHTAEPDGVMGDVDYGTKDDVTPRAKKRSAASGRRGDGEEVAGKPRLLQTKQELFEKPPNYVRYEGLTFDVGIGDEFWGVGIAAVGYELDHVVSLRADVRVNGTLHRYDQNSFVGFIVDYHTTKGYTKRIGLSLGMSDRGRMGTPNWGKRTTPDLIVNLIGKPTNVINLKEWAPPDWDGRIWFCVLNQNGGKNTSVTGRLIIPGLR